MILDDRDENIFFIGEFDHNFESILMNMTHEIRKQSEKVDGYIDLYITSAGGDYFMVKHAVELVEVAKRQGVTVRTIVPVAAYSAGSMLAVAGTPGERYIGKDADHLVHYGSVAGLEESTPLQTGRAGKWKTKGWKRIVNHYETYCSIPNLEEHLKDDYGFIPARDCIKWSLADKYMDKLQP